MSHTPHELTVTYMFLTPNISPAQNYLLSYMCITTVPRYHYLEVLCTFQTQHTSKFTLCLSPQTSPFYSILVLATGANHQSVVQVRNLRNLISHCQAAEPNSF